MANTKWSEIFSSKFNPNKAKRKRELIFPFDLYSDDIRREYNVWYYNLVKDREAVEKTKNYFLTDNEKAVVDELNGEYKIYLDDIKKKDPEVRFCVYLPQKRLYPQGSYVFPSSILRRLCKNYYYVIMDNPVCGSFYMGKKWRMMYNIDECTETWLVHSDIEDDSFFDLVDKYRRVQA